MTPEGKFKVKAMKALRKLPRTWVVKYVAVSITGVPDLLICCNGCFVAWELKVGSNKPTKKQIWTSDRINTARGIARIVYPENLDDAIKELKLLCY